MLSVPEFLVAFHTIRTFEQLKEIWRLDKFSKKYVGRRTAAGPSYTSDFHERFFDVACFEAFAERSCWREEEEGSDIWILQEQGRRGQEMYVTCLTLQVCSDRRITWQEKEYFLLWRLFANVITFNYVLDSKKKPEISYPTQFEHTIHVGFDPVTSEFTVSHKLNSLKLNFAVAEGLQVKTKSICQLRSSSTCLHRVFWNEVACLSYHEQTILSRMEFLRS